MTKFDYEKLLKSARKDLPQQAQEAVRFEIPRFEAFIQGSKTVIRNFADVTRTLQREKGHLLKYMLIEAGAGGETTGPRLVLKGRKTQDFLNSKLEAYVKEFVLCKQCKKPDTEIRKEEGIDRIKCKACGAKYTIRQF